jgi:uncharacterized membrane protein
VVFSRWGFVGLSIYLVLLYGVTHVFLRPQGLPSAPVQLLTFIFYALVIAGLWLHRRREPMPGTAVQVETRESRLVRILFALILGLALVLSVFTGTPVLLIPVVVSFVIWTPLGFVLTAVALVSGVGERMTPARGHRD